jgi:hypothetical protein
VKVSAIEIVDVIVVIVGQPPLRRG